MNPCYETLFFSVVDKHTQTKKCDYIFTLVDSHLEVIIADYTTMQSSRQSMVGFEWCKHVDHLTSELLVDVALIGNFDNLFNSKNVITTIKNLYPDEIVSLQEFENKYLTAIINSRRPNI